ncbi:hypothetical protein RI367_005376 [Sorochytrium milnesiophthora]
MFNLRRGGTQYANSTAASFLRSRPELMPLLVAVTFGCAFGVKLIYDKTRTDPDLRLRQDQGKHLNWEARMNPAGHA